MITLVLLLYGYTLNVKEITDGYCGEIVDCRENIIVDSKFQNILEAEKWFELKVCKLFVNENKHPTVLFCGITGDIIHRNLEAGKYSDQSIYEYFDRIRSTNEKPPIENYNVEIMKGGFILMSFK